MWMIALAGIILIGVGVFVANRTSTTTPTASPTIPFTKPTLGIAPASDTTTTPAPIPTPGAFIAPIADFKARITKKFFGTYVTPKSSPVQPERFTGYHTGVDVEYQDITTQVPVVAIADGTVRRANYTSGYGGLVVVEHAVNGKHLFSLYGHLRTSSLPKVGIAVKQGDQIGVLGTGYSPETDGERRHLHFAIVTTTSFDVRGYVSSTQTLNSIWMNPLALYP